MGSIPIQSVTLTGSRMAEPFKTINFRRCPYCSEKSLFAKGQSWRFSGSPVEETCVIEMECNKCGKQSMWVWEKD